MLAAVISSTTTFAFVLPHAELDGRLIKQAMSIIGLTPSQEMSLEGLQAYEGDQPLVIFSFFQSAASKNFKESNRIRPNNVEYIDVLLNYNRAPLPLTQVNLGSKATALAERISIAEQKILQRTRPQSAAIDEDFYLRFNMIGNSQNYLKAIKMLKKIARTDSRVLISGETGTGKELAARAIHYFSARTHQPFVPINCGAFSDDLLLSELFGYKKGAFTGANADSAGLLEHANNGTILLDEVDELSSRAQVALLRFLQEGEIRPVGGRSVIKVNVRVVAASNKNLKQLVTEGKFREDLLYRLNVLAITLPPLRQRGNDLLLIAQSFLAKFSQDLKAPPKFLSLRFIEVLKSHQWPGNFRELESELLRCFVMTESELVDHSDTLPFELTHSPFDDEATQESFNTGKQQMISKFEKDYILKVLKATSGNISRAAIIAQKERRAFTRLMEKHKIDRANFIADKRAS